MSTHVYTCLHTEGSATPLERPKMMLMKRGEGGAEGGGGGIGGRPRTDPFGGTRLHDN